jgi:hypothetical protein
MPIPITHRHRLVYHFTLLDNLPGIIQGGLLSPNAQRRQRATHRSIAEQGIQAGRARMRVPCGPGGVVHDYVPFYFTNLSPMLQSVVKGTYQPANGRARKRRICLHPPAESHTPTDQELYNMPLYAHPAIFIFIITHTTSESSIRRRGWWHASCCHPSGWQSHL